MSAKEKKLKYNKKNKENWNFFRIIENNENMRRIEDNKIFWFLKEYWKT